MSHPSVKPTDIPSNLGRNTALLILGLGCLFALLLLPAEGQNSELLRTLSDATHGPLFALTAVGWLWWFRQFRPTVDSKHQYASAFFVAVLLGALGEIAQLLFTTTRHAQLKDILVDACGALAGLCLLARSDKQLQLRTRHRRAMMPLALSASMIVVAPIAWSSAFYLNRWVQAPELITFDSKFGYHFLSAGNATTMLALVPPQFAAHPNEYALYVTPQLNNRWAGITLEEPVPDWRAYANLEIEIINPNSAPLELLLRIDDRNHNQEFTDRFNRTLTVGAKQRSVQIIALSDIEQAPATRQMALDEMARLVLFQDTQRHPQSFYLRGLRLNK